MTEEKNKLDFTKLATKKRTSPTPNAPKKVYKEVSALPAEPTPEKITGKVGRKSWKTEGVQYVRMAFDTPVEMKKQLKLLLFDKFADTYISQDEMINAALLEFIKKNGK
jgi:hypothetical protein